MSFLAAAHTDFSAEAAAIDATLSFDAFRETAKEKGAAT